LQRYPEALALGLPIAWRWRSVLLPPPPSDSVIDLEERENREHPALPIDLYDEVDCRLLKSVVSDLNRKREFALRRLCFLDSLPGAALSVSFPALGVHAAVDVAALPTCSNHEPG